MPAKVILQVTRGELAGREFVFDERTTCIIGPAKDCEPRVPNDQEHRRISRHHCLLDINPPDVRVRDFGSLNGTWVNGRKIGHREKRQTAEEAASGLFPEYDLKDGDEIRLGNTVFRVRIHTPIACANCGKEIPEQEQPDKPESTMARYCEARRWELAKARKPPRRTVIEDIRVCARCGRDVTGETGAERQGEYVCAQCRSDPMDLLRKMLSAASRAYLLREHRLEQLTKDHSIVQLLLDCNEITADEVATHPSRGRLTRFVGMQAESLPEVRLVDLQPNDCLLLCSDGLTGMLDGAAILAILDRASQPEEACSRLVAAANEAGGRDNVTVLAVSVGEALD